MKNKILLFIIYFTTHFLYSLNTQADTAASDDRLKKIERTVKTTKALGITSVVLLAVPSVLGIGAAILFGIGGAKNIAYQNRLAKGYSGGVAASSMPRRYFGSASS